MGQLQGGHQPDAHYLLLHGPLRPGWLRLDVALRQLTAWSKEDLIAGKSSSE